MGAALSESGVCTTSGLSTTVPAVAMPSSSTPSCEDSEVDTKAGGTPASVTSSSSGYSVVSPTSNGTSMNASTAPAGAPSRVVTGGRTEWLESGRQRHQSAGQSDRLHECQRELHPCR